MLQLRNTSRISGVRVNFPQKRARRCGHRPDVVAISARLVDAGATRPDFGQCLPRFEATSSKFGPESADTGRIRPLLARSWPDLGRLQPDSANFGMFSAGFGPWRVRCAWNRSDAARLETRSWRAHRDHLPGLAAYRGGYGVGLGPRRSEVASGWTRCGLGAIVGPPLGRRGAASRPTLCRSVRIPFGVGSGSIFVGWVWIPVLGRCAADEGLVRADARRAARPMVTFAQPFYQAGSFVAPPPGSHGPRPAGPGLISVAFGASPLRPRSATIPSAEAMVANAQVRCARARAQAALVSRPLRPS